PEARLPEARASPAVVNPSFAFCGDVTPLAAREASDAETSADDDVAVRELEGRVHAEVRVLRASLRVEQVERVHLTRLDAQLARHLVEVNRLGELRVWPPEADREPAVE